GSLFSMLGSNQNAVFPPFFGHGTLVAGLIHVVAPGARIAPIKAFDAYGKTTMFTVIEGVYAAIEMSADVLNMSFSTTEESETFETAINAARAAGIAIVASAGNDARDAQGLYPAGFNGVYGVAATDWNDRRAAFSNYGRDVSVAAPGVFVISTVPGNRYGAAWGTSFSAPLVSGATSLLMSGGAQAQSSISLVVNTADSIDNLNPGFERKLGRGRINVNRALRQR
ncbi:MAG: S8 family serine peptidase, partial [Acidobacteria bacterium]|nr:S8 family serine peptidase [Acidobacteriota bacterium]